MATAPLQKLTAIIRTADQPKAITRLLKSLRRKYPDLRILVADDGVEAAKCRHVEYLRLPSGKGLAAAQNAMLARLRTPYFLVLDQCCEVPKEAAVEGLLELVTRDHLDIAAGSLISCRRRFWFFVSRKAVPGHAILEVGGDHLSLQQGGRSQGDGFWWCDYVPQFYVGRTDRIRAMGGWDPELKNDCHEEFFYRAHCHGIRVGVKSDVAIPRWQSALHPTEPDTNHNLLGLATAKMGLSELTTLDGVTARAPRLARAA